MIDSITQPQQILVIDDNQLWLNSLVGLGIIVLNVKNKSHRDIVDFIQPIETTISIVLVNMHLIQTLGTNRVDNHGSFLVDKLLKVRFPNLRFVFISFCSEFTLSHQCLVYNDFLTYINTHFYGRSNNN